MIAAHGLGARKGLGQHFLLDLNLTGRIAAAATSLSEGTVIEIGPGPGGLTRALLLAGATRVVAVERDRRCIAALAPLVDASAGRLTVIEADALGIAAETLGPPPRRIVANLPYNVGTQLLLGWLERPTAVTEMILMFQREVGERLVAVPGDGAYGRLSVLVRWLTEARPVFALPARAFTPPPKVDSIVVRLTPRAAPLEPAPREAFERVTAAAFGQRRKMLRRSLRTLAADPMPLIEAAGLDPTTRAETVDVAGYAALARAWAATR